MDLSSRYTSFHSRRLCSVMQCADYFASLAFRHFCFDTTSTTVHFVRRMHLCVSWLSGWSGDFVIMGQRELAREEKVVCQLHSFRALWLNCCTLLVPLRLHNHSVLANVQRHMCDINSNCADIVLNRLTYSICAVWWIIIYIQPRSQMWPCDLMI